MRTVFYEVYLKINMPHIDSSVWGILLLVTTAHDTCYLFLCKVITFFLY